MIEIITGEDRYRVLTRKRKLVKEGAEIIGEITDEIRSSANFISLFGIRKYILDCRSMEDYSAEELFPFVESSFVELYVFPEIAQGGKCMTQLERKGVRRMQLDKVSKADLDAFVAKYVANAGRRMEIAAYEMFVHRCAYFESPESDLGTVVNELDKLLAVCGGDICVADVDRYTESVPAANIFDLSDLVVRKRRKEALALADQLMQRRDFDAIRTIALLEQCYRVGYKASLLSGSQQSKAQALGVRMIRTIAPEEALYGLQVIDDAKNCVKSGNSAEAILIRLICQLTLWYNGRR